MRGFPVKYKLYQCSLLCLIIVVIFLVSLSVVSGQGPVLTTLPTPTPMAITSETNSSFNLTSPPEGGSEGGLPDLIVQKIETKPAIPKVGQAAIISVTIKNIGLAPLNTGNNFNTDLYIDPPIDPVVNYHQIVSPTLGLPWGGQWFLVPPGGSHVFTTTWVFTDVETFAIWAQVDSDGNVTEANEENNTKQANVKVETVERFFQATHQDFLTNMASTLDNNDPSGMLRLGRFSEPPFFERPFTNGACQITSDLLISDYNMTGPDARVNEVTTGKQINPHLVTNGDEVIIAVWEDSRNGEILDRDIFLRYSMDSGLTWGGEIRVNDDPAGANQLNPVAALSGDGHLLVAWQDYRNGNYDIYAQRFQLSGTTLTRVGDNIQVASDDVGEEQIRPDIAVDEAGGFYVAWQDKRNGNYDIFATSFVPVNGTFMWTEVRRVHDDPNLTQQSNPAINAIDWRQIEGIEYDIGPAPDYEVTVTEIISKPVTVLAIVWEDYRKDNADIAIAISQDEGETFGFDDFINDDADPADPPDPLAPDQLDPDVALTKDKAVVTISVPLPDGTERGVEVEIPVTGIHTVWQDYRNSTPENSDPDIYYSLSQLGVEQVDNIFNPKLTVGANEKLNQDDLRAWQTMPVIQQEPTITSVRCGGEATEAEWNVFMAWADGRNYDNANYDLFYTVRSTCGASFEGNEMLNDGIRLYNFDNTDPNYADYDPGHPPPGRQVNPSVTADIRLEGSTVFSGYLYLVWEDDRAGNPQVEKDIYFARSNLTFSNQVPYVLDDGAGSYISNILDSRTADTTWFTVDWSAATDDSTYVTVQTRLGNTISEVLASPWYPQRFPYQPQPGACDNVFNDAFDSGAPLPGHDSPGQHIEDALGNFWPQARYIQYRVNFYTRDSRKTPELYDLTIFYKRGTNISHSLYLPLVLK
jgi:hypothetical protein